MASQVTMQASTLDAIWEGDLFGRRAEAQLLVGYIESVAGRTVDREDARGFTIAVDAGYGEGKTFFLKRLAEQLKLNHPVAFVDAWADDLADEPLTALAATLRRALDPLIKQSPDVRSQWSSVMDKTGKVAKIVGKGLARRGVGLLIGASAAGAMEMVLSDATDAVKDVVNEGLKDSGNEAVEVVSGALSSVTPHRLMEQRIAEFEEGKAAIQEMKDSLAALVQSLDKSDRFPPIVIVIDELDRCRPTYAVKLREEIKHLFDVPGLAFVLGMHGDQLSRSINGAYGATFDGPSYLRRFISRQYQLSSPDLTPLVSHLLDRARIPLQRLAFLDARITKSEVELNSVELVGRYMKAYGLAARDAFQVIDILQTSCALTKDAPLFMGYLLPLIAAKIKGREGDFLKHAGPPDWEFVLWSGSNRSTIDPWNFANQVKNLVGLSYRQLDNAAREEEAFGLATVLLQFTVKVGAENTLAHPARYPELLETVSRFTNPALQP